MTVRFLAALALLAAAPTAAQTVTPAAAACRAGDKLINKPGANWTAYGPYKAKWIKDTKNEDTPEAWQVQVDKGTSPYSTAALSPISSPIATGDTVMVEVWMRAPKVAAGQTTPVPFSAGEVDSPYTPIAQGNADVGPEWKLYRTAGKSPKSFAVGKARASIHLAAATHMVELGAILMFDCGQNQDPAKING